MRLRLALLMRGVIYLAASRRFALLKFECAPAPQKTAATQSDETWGLLTREGPLTLSAGHGCAGGRAMISDSWDLALAAEWEAETATVQIVEPWHCRSVARFRPRGGRNQDRHAKLGGRD